MQLPGNSTGYPEVAQFTGIVTQRLYNFQVTIPGDRTISGYGYLDILQPPGNDTQKLFEKIYLNKLNEIMAKFDKNFRV